MWTWGKVKVSTRSDYDAQMLGIRRLQHVQKIHVDGYWKRHEQTNLFKAIDRLENLSHLCISQANLSSLDPELLVTVVNKAEELQLNFCQMNTKQAIAMCEGFFDKIEMKIRSHTKTYRHRHIDMGTLVTEINELKTVCMTFAHTPLRNTLLVEVFMFFFSFKNC